MDQGYTTKCCRLSTQAIEPMDLPKLSISLGKREPMAVTRYRSYGLAFSCFLAALFAQRVNAQEEAVEAALRDLQESGAEVDYTFRFDPDNFQPTISRISFQGNRRVTNSDLAPIAELTSVFRVDLDGTAIDDIASLKHLEKMTFLDLEGTAIDSSDLIHLKGLKSLKTLVLSGTGIADDGLDIVSGMVKLTELRLNGTRVSDGCLVHFEALANLRELHLQDTQVTDGGVARLQERLPTCEIKR